MKTNSLTHPVFSYILDCYNDSYSNENGIKEPENNREKLQLIIDTFKKEQGYNINRMGLYKAFCEWLMGLPSVINVDFEYYKILELAYKWGNIQNIKSERMRQAREDLILDQWFPYITNKFFRLCKHYKVEF